MHLPLKRWFLSNGLQINAQIGDGHLLLALKVQLKPLG